MPNFVALVLQFTALALIPSTSAKPTPPDSLGAFISYHRQTGRVESQTRQRKTRPRSVRRTIPSFICAIIKWFTISRLKRRFQTAQEDLSYTVAEEIMEGMDVESLTQDSGVLYWHCPYTLVALRRGTIRSGTWIVSYLFQDMHILGHEANRIPVDELVWISYIWGLRACFGDAVTWGDDGGKKIPDGTQACN